MSTKNRFGARIKKLEENTANRKPVLIWIEPDENAEAAARRYLSEHPEDAGREVLCLSWCG
ncbi:hypothetical protein NNJEOMEG_00170 [Fundidesulfovibrio magnetotacticus]|uniref:Uncharacterized protein n=1 Tax=Fundidesulfovibrio magnetotacticus TaxID=2730080 RepID=A0A6V8LRE6_9BACT|nr:hypothetical protein [Fundidesulfovibrio magnetotacticus]GFK92346.1 hypothetical protein NNJEOMEG_00170 [Fundidesulfovibrio magnetotacticus]